MLSLSAFHVITADGLCNDLKAGPKVKAFGSQSPVPYVKARKDTKTLSQAGGFALAALEACKSEGEDWKKGLFVSAPAPAASDKLGFTKTLRAEGDNPFKKLGEGLDQAMPVTGLIGLPNGVMCFGSKVTGAFGPNTVAVNDGTGCHQALATAMRHAHNGTISSAIVSGFAQPNLETNRCQYAAMGLVAPIESDEDLKLTDSAMSSEFVVGEGQVEVHDAFLFEQDDLVRDRLKRLGWLELEVGIVFQAADNKAPQTAISKYFSEAQRFSTYSEWGYQAEAGGLLELGVILQAVKEGDDSSLSAYRLNVELTVDMSQAQKFVIFGRSIYGQQSCVMGRINP